MCCGKMFKSLNPTDVILSTSKMTVLSNQGVGLHVCNLMWSTVQGINSGSLAMSVIYTFRVWRFKIYK